MLPDIASEALLFLTRRDLDKACAISKWLDAMIARCCGVYPFRTVERVWLIQSSSDYTLRVWIENYGDSTDNPFRTMDEAVHLAGPILRQSYVKYFEVNFRKSRG